MKWKLVTKELNLGSLSWGAAKSTTKPSARPSLDKLYERHLKRILSKHLTIEQSSFYCSRHPIMFQARMQGTYEQETVFMAQKLTTSYDRLTTASRPTSLTLLLPPRPNFPIIYACGPAKAQSLFQIPESLYRFIPNELKPAVSHETRVCRNRTQDLFASDHHRCRETMYWWLLD